MGTTADKLQHLVDTKEMIKTAIIGKGQPIADSEPFGDYAGKIDDISFECTATPEMILNGKTAYSGGNKITGTMPIKTAETFAPSVTARTIPLGRYLSGTQTINPVTGTAGVGDVLSGKTFASANGVGITGTMTSRGAVTSTISTQGGQYTVPSGYHNGSGKVTASFANLSAGNIKSGVNVGGVVGSLEAVQNRTINISNNYANYDAVVNICCGNSLAVSFDGKLSLLPATINTYGDIITIVVRSYYISSSKYHSISASSGATMISSLLYQNGNYMITVRTMSLTASSVSLFVSYVNV